MLMERSNIFEVVKQLVKFLEKMYGTTFGRMAFVESFFKLIQQVYVTINNVVQYIDMHKFSSYML